MKAANHAGFRPRAGVLSLAITEVFRDVWRHTSAHRLAPSILAASGGAILASALAVVPATPTWAQDEEQPPQQLEQITVTGSRIRRQDFTANAPIVTE